MRFTPHAYQAHAIDRILAQPAIGLLLFMGAGKTVSTLTAADELMNDRGEVNRVLVIAPKRVAESTWATEAAKWEHLRHLRVSRVLGTLRERLAALARPADVYVVNRENVPWLVEHFGRGWPFDMVVVDESSSFKSPTAQRFKALRRVRPLVTRMVILTGTPAPNTYLDLWPQLYLLDRGERLGKTVTEYRDRYFTPERKNGHIVYSWRLRPGAREAIEAAIADICVSMRQEDWLALPLRIDRTVHVVLDRQARARYDELEREQILELGDAPIVAANAAALTGKLLQLANGAVYREGGEAVEIHDAKLDALAEIVEAAAGAPVLVFYAFKHDLARIRQHLAHVRELTGEADVRAWNEGRVPVLAAHPASAGHGLNLQAGGSIVVWFGLTWSLELYQQANARLHRQGQTQPVVVHHLVATGTVDEDVMQTLHSKAEGQNALINALRARIEKHRQEA